MFSCSIVRLFNCLFKYSFFHSFVFNDTQPN
nr:MAG TPA: hypothetical protein [Caudoviricetes sp.]